MGPVARCYRTMAQCVRACVQARKGVRTCNQLNFPPVGYAEEWSRDLGASQRGRTGGSGQRKKQISAFNPARKPTSSSSSTQQLARNPTTDQWQCVSQPARINAHKHALLCASVRAHSSRVAVWVCVWVPMRAGVPKIRNIRGKNIFRLTNRGYFLCIRKIL